MELRLSYASMDAIAKALGTLAHQHGNGEEPELVMPIEGGPELVRVTFVDEDNAEFAEPSASVSR